MRQSCPHKSVTITKMDSIAQFSCVFPSPHLFSERSQEIDIQVIVLTQRMYISAVFYKKVTALW